MKMRVVFGKVYGGDLNNNSPCYMEDEVDIFAEIDGSLMIIYEDEECEKELTSWHYCKEHNIYVGNDGSLDDVLYIVQ
jgi:hypothetical protein